MEKGKYYISVSKQTDNGREQIAEERNGYLFNAYGLDFGVCKEGGGEWRATELKTGFAVTYGRTRKEAAEKVTKELVDRIAVKMRDEWRRMEKYYDLIRKAYAA